MMYVVLPASVYFRRYFPFISPKSSQTRVTAVQQAISCPGPRAHQTWQDPGQQLQ